MIPALASTSPLQNVGSLPELQTLKKQIIVGWIVLLLLLTTLGTWFLVYSRVSYIRRQGVNSQNLASALKQHIESDLNATDAILKSTVREYTYLKNNGTMSDTEVHRHIDHLSDMLLDSHLAFMHITDADGNVVYGVKPPEILKVAEREYFKSARNSPDAGLLISKPIKGIRTGRWTIYLTRRMNNPDGSFAGIVYVSSRVESYRDMFSHVNIGPGGAIVLRSADTSFVTRFPDVPGSDVNIGKLDKSPPQLRAALKSGVETGTYLFHSPTDNTRRISSFARCTPYPFIIIAGYGYNETLKPWFIELAVVSTVLLLTAFLAALAGRRIWSDAIRQVRHLNEIRDKEQLEILNARLQREVTENIAELRSKDMMLISQSRRAAMGEMIGNIAHQWRQPLNAMSTLIINLEHAYHDGDLTGEYFDKTTATAGRLIQKMSATINDFRDFFRPDKSKAPFSALNKINNTVGLLEATFKKCALYD